MRIDIRTSGSAPLNLPSHMTSLPGVSWRCPGTGAGTDDRLDDATLAELCLRDLVDDPATRHDHDAIAETGELERVARLDDRGDAFLRLRAQRAVDVEARGDVDALRRLLRQDHLDVTSQERAREGDLLLISTGERLDGLLDRRRPDAQTSHEPVDRPALASAAEETHRPEPSQYLDRG